jgi:hypothetical protein
MNQPAEEEASMTEVSIVGVDLAKQAFQLHAAARDGRVVFRRKLSRSKFIDVMAKLPRCIVAMEACATAHHWGRVLGAQGHEVGSVLPGLSALHTACVAGCLRRGHERELVDCVGLGDEAEGVIAEHVAFGRKPFGMPLSHATFDRGRWRSGLRE